MNEEYAVKIIKHLDADKYRLFISTLASCNGKLIFASSYRTIGKLYVEFAFKEGDDYTLFTNKWNTLTTPIIEKKASKWREFKMKVLRFLKGF